jgi:hypothetical protein
VPCPPPSHSQPTCLLLPAWAALAARRGHTLPRACACLPDVPGLPDCLSLAGLWAAKPVQCAIGDYLPGDYSGWKRWRDALPSVAHI